MLPAEQNAESLTRRAAVRFVAAGHRHALVAAMHRAFHEGDSDASRDVLGIVRGVRDTFFDGRSLDGEEVALVNGFDGLIDRLEANANRPPRGRPTLSLVK